MCRTMGADTTRYAEVLALNVLTVLWGCPGHSAGVMLAGVVFLSQPWFEVLHRYSVTITIIGLVGFIVFSHIKPDPDAG